MTGEGYREKDVKAALKKHLKSVGAHYYMPVTFGMGSAHLDFIVCHKGKYYGIETKRDGVKEPTARQLFIMEEVIAAGGKAWVENSTGLEKTREMLK